MDDLIILSSMGSNPSYIGSSHANTPPDTDMQISLEQFWLLRDNASKRFTYMEGAFAENSFAIPDSLTFQTNNPPVHGLFLLLSRFSYSCLPNSKIPITVGDIIACFAT